MRHAIFGVVFIIVALFVLPKGLDLVGLPGSAYVSPSAIFGTIQNISGTIFHTNSANFPDTINPQTSTGINADFTDL